MLGNRESGVLAGWTAADRPANFARSLSEMTAMLKLYYAPATCALASHITLEEVGAPYSGERLNFKNNQNPRSATR